MHPSVLLMYDITVEALNRLHMKYFSKNGTLLPITEAVIPIQDIAYQYGFGVYETLKIRKYIPYFIKQHIERLFQSASMIGISHTFSESSIESSIASLISISDESSFNIKILLIGAPKTDEASIYILPLPPLYPDKKLFTHGAKVETTVYERYLPNAKSLNMLQSYIQFTKANGNGCYDMVFTDATHHILEGSRTNFFAIRGDILFTAPKEKVLEGVTRQTVISVAQKNRYSVKETLIPLDDVSTFDGAFLTSTSSNIVPIIQINEFKFSGISEHLKLLMNHYAKFLDNSKGIFLE